MKLRVKLLVGFAKVTTWVTTRKQRTVAVLGCGGKYSVLVNADQPVHAVELARVPLQIALPFTATTACRASRQRNKTKKQTGQQKKSHAAKNKKI